jgi:hypothetical protein
MPALQASRAHPETVMSDTIQWEVVLGDPSSTGDDRRCASLEALRDMRSELARTNLAKSAEAAFLHYQGDHYCSTGAPDLD